MNNKSEATITIASVFTGDSRLAGTLQCSVSLALKNAAKGLSNTYLLVSQAGQKPELCVCIKPLRLFEFLLHWVSAKTRTVFERQSAECDVRPLRFPLVLDRWSRRSGPACAHGIPQWLANRDGRRGRGVDVQALVGPNDCAAYGRGGFWLRMS